MINRIGGFVCVGDVYINADRVRTIYKNPEQKLNILGDKHKHIDSIEVIYDNGDYIDLNVSARNFAQACIDARKSGELIDLNA